MVATHILMAQRAAALERLGETLGGLDGADAEVVQETAERAAHGHAGADYMTALFLGEVAQVLAAQQDRITNLEGQLKQPKQTTKKGR